jgi:hypothetical protein
MQNIVCNRLVGSGCVHGILLLQGRALHLQHATQGHRQVPSGLAEDPQQRRESALRQSGSVRNIRLDHPGKNRRGTAAPAIQDSLIWYGRTVCLVLISAPVI